MKSNRLLFFIVIIFLTVCSTLMMGVKFRSGPKTVSLKLRLDWSNWSIGSGIVCFSIPADSLIIPSQKSYHFLPMELTIHTEEPR